jgi:hypothetical protein
MDTNKTTLERAFELAQSGQCADLQKLILRLKAEGYKPSQVVGPLLRKQLMQLMQTSCHIQTDTDA